MNEVSVIRRNDLSPIMSDFIKQSGLRVEDFEKEASFAIQAIAGNDLLQKCSKESLMKCVLNVAQTGLTLNPVRKFAYIVPRYNSKRSIWEGVLEPSYVGLCKLITDAGVVKTITAQLVWNGDEIDIDLANHYIKHTPYVITGKPRGEIKAVYSLAILTDGTKHLELMSIQDVDEIMERSTSYIAFKAGKTKSCIWVADKGEMTRKTVIKRHYKYLPKSHEVEFVEQAIEADNNVNGYEKDEEFTIQKYMYIERLIQTCSLPEEKMKQIELELEPGVTDSRANEIITYLNNNQKDNIRDGGNYSATDISNKLSKEIL